MNKRIRVKTKEPYHHNPNIKVEYEMDFNGETILPNTKLRFSGSKAPYYFRYKVTNSDLNKTWIDCMNIKTGAFHSYDIKLLQNIVKDKKKKWQTKHQVK